MAENNLGNTQYFRTKPDADLEVKEVLDLIYNTLLKEIKLVLRETEPMQ